MKGSQPQRENRRTEADVGPGEQALRGILWTITVWLALLEGTVELARLVVSSWS